MNLKFRLMQVCALAVAVLFILGAPGTALAQEGNVSRRLITQAIDEGRLTTLHGNTRSEANSLNDRGVVPFAFRMEHMMLQLKRSPEQEAALQKFMDEQNGPDSANYHHWLTAQELGDKFGPSAEDIDTITSWLREHGLEVNIVYPNKMVIDFSGTAGQVQEAFRTEIHNLNVNGRSHYANMTDPQIPEALSAAVVGVVSLHDFRPHPMHKPRANYTFTSGGSTYQAVVPADLATIYNLNPLFSAGNSGQGQTIAVLEDTNVYSTADWTTFRSTFGLSGYSSGSFTQVHPGSNCSNPGVLVGNDGEAILDAEYASAAAPSAAIELASCTDTSTFGGLIALQNLISAGNPPAIISISYGECEAENGASANAAFNSAYQSAAAGGVSVFVSSGDEGAASCDADQANSTHGIGVSGFASTPYNVAVGGTDFGDTVAGTNSTYWNSTNTSTYGSAKSYIPEIPWNDSCASVLLASAFSYSTTYGSTGFCNSSTASSDGYHTTASGSGGPSGCATGSATTSGVVSGSCAGWGKPTWQSLVGVPADGVRDIPDVSLFAANGVWGHYYVFCYSDTAGGGAACTGAPSGWAGAGGTSFASPILAGIQALVNQKTGSKQGNPNPTYYKLAATEYGTGGSSSCNSTLGNGAGSSCVFYDVTKGDMDVNCTGTHNCYKPSGTYGVLSTSNSAYQLAYGTTTGWDFATGIGTVNAANLVANWPGSTQTPSFTLSASPSSVAVTQGKTATSTITITPSGGFSGSVTLSASGLPSGVTAGFSPNPATGTSTVTFTATGTATTGTVSVTIGGTGSGVNSSTIISVTVNAAAQPGFTLSASPSSVSVTQGKTATSTITITPSGGFSGSVTLSASGLPSGVTAGFSPNPATSTSTVTFTATSTATTGTVNVTIGGTGSGATGSTTVSLTVSPAATGNFTLSASPTSVTITRGAKGTSTITISPSGGFTGSVTLSASGMRSGTTAAFSPNPATGTSTLTFTASSSATTGTVTVTVTGKSGTLTHTTTVSLRVRR